MVIQAETTMEMDPLSAGLEKIIERQQMNEDDGFRLRQDLYRQAPLDDQKVDRIFQAHRRLPSTDLCWVEFFVEALSEVFLTRQDDQILLSEAAEKRLIKALGEVNPMVDPGYRRLVLRLFLRATKVSEHFQHLVLETVHHHLTNDDRRFLVDLPRQPGCIDIVDLQLIRKLVYGAGAQYPARVSRAAADFLLRLDRESFSFVDADAWHHLLLKAIPLHLITVRSKDDSRPEMIDEAAADWFVEQVDNGRSGRNTASLISGFKSRFDLLPPNLQMLVGNR